MGCTICGRSVLARNYMVGKIKLSICDKCLGSFKFRHIEICPLCGMMTIVTTDQAQARLTAINLTCFDCVGGDDDEKV